MSPAGARFVGQSIKRREDPRLVSGHGRYIDDVVLPGMLHVAFLRSPVARGVITRLDVEAARQHPGVVAVFTGAEINQRCGPMHPTSQPPNPEAPHAPLRPMAEGDVRYVGDPVALVVAENRYVAEDACDLIELEVEPGPPVLDLEAALAEGAPVVHPEVGSNIAGAIPAMPDPELEQILASAPHVVTRTFRQQRQTNVPMETRGIVAQYDRYAGDLRVWASSQNIHEWRAYCARVAGLPENRVRAVMGDVGGGFGQKAFALREDAAVVVAAKELARPLKWIEDRQENLMAANSARHEQATVTMALDDDGHILAAKVHHVEDVGAHPPGGGGAGGGFVAMMFTGPYRIPRFGFSGTSVFTNTVGKAPYRGPWMMETVAREQMMDHVARELGIDPVELRRRNVVRQEDLPYQLPSGLVYDVVTPAENLEQATAMLDYEGFRAAQEEARAQGRYLGVGVGLYVEPSAVAFSVWATDQANIRIEPSGQVNVLMGVASHGHSLETTIPQVVADHLGCDIEDVVLQQGDTAVAPFGAGTGGSRSAVIAGGAAQQGATQLREKVLQIAGSLLEAAPEDLEIDRSVISVRGTPAKTLRLADVAAAAYLNTDVLPAGMEPGLEVVARYKPPAPFTWSNACHVCTCEIDVHTGIVKLLRYIVSEDCGVMINPMVVEGQIAGGVVQGIGGVLFEEVRYDADGNPLTTTFLDYLIPTAPEVPIIEYGHIETESNTLGGYKGMGEGGAIGSPPAVANAIADALAPLGVTVTDLPLGPSQVLALLHP